MAISYIGGPMSILPDSVSPFLTVDAAAELLGVNPKTIRRAISRGQLGAVQPAGRKGGVRIPKAALEQYLTNSLVGARG